MRRIADITHNGRPLADILADHEKWLRGEGGARANLVGANLADVYLAGAYLAGAYFARADLAGADLAGADLAGADLNDTRGNMREVRSAQFDRWACTWTRSPEGETVLQIGCQRHPLDLWIKSDPRWIGRLDDRATEWWARYREPLLALIEAAPATPYGKAPEREAA